MYLCNNIDAVNSEVEYGVKFSWINIGTKSEISSGI